MIVFGRNPNREVNSILNNSRIKGQNLKIDMPNEESFLIYEKVPDNFESPLFDEFIFFDENGKEIEFYH